MKVKKVNSRPDGKELFEVCDVRDAEKEAGGNIKIVDDRTKVVITKEAAQHRLDKASAEVDKWTDVVAQITALE